MSENINRNSLWNEGGKAALILGAVSIIYTLSTTLIAKISGGPMISAIVSVVNMMLWFAKFAGCILLMRFFMMKLVRKYPGTDNKTTFKFGTIISFLSALIVSAYSLASVLMMSSEEINILITQRLGDNLKMLDLNTRNMLTGLIDNIQIYTFFITLIYCFLFGLILSMILSKNIPSRNPFENHKDPDNQ